MEVANVSESVPLHADAHGTIRVSGTRVTLETLLDGFDRGSTPEELTRDLPGLALADVYAVITFYLRHRRQVDTYRRAQHERGQEIREAIESDPEQARFRERILARIQAKEIA